MKLLGLSPLPSFSRDSRSKNVSHKIFSKGKKIGHDYSFFSPIILLTTFCVVLAKVK